MSYDDVVMNVTPWMRAHYLFRRLVGKALNFRRGERALNLMAAAVGLMLQRARGERELKEAVRRLAEDANAAAPPRSLDWDPLAELYRAAHYRAEVEGGQLDRRRSDSAALYGWTIDALGRLLQSDRGITRVVECGVSYAYVISRVASQFPGVQIFGVDRSEATTRYNDVIFAGLPNLHFIAGDIFDVLGQTNGPGGVFLHTRTMALLPPSVVTRVYQEAARSGFTYVVGGEQCGISWQTGRPYRFSDEDQASVILRNNVYVHNYPALLRKAGFTLRERTLLATNHLDPTLRVLCFVAVREGTVA